MPAPAPRPAPKAPTPAKPPQPPARPTFGPAFSRTIAAIGGTLILTSLVLPAIQGRALDRLFGDHLVRAAGTGSHLVGRFLPPECYALYVPESVRPEGDPPTISLPQSGNLEAMPGLGASPSQLACALGVALRNHWVPGELEVRRWAATSAFFVALAIFGLLALVLGLNGRGEAMGGGATGILLGLAISILGSAGGAGWFLRIRMPIDKILDVRGASFALGGTLLVLLGSLYSVRREIALKSILIAVLPMAAAGGVCYWLIR